jgi:transport and Golgi organization protein 2
MCTLSWRPEPCGFELWFSRDERRGRAPARAPELHQVGGVPFLAPRDPEGGGSWLTVNARGLALALLNDYGAPTRSGRFESRGVLVLSLAAARGFDEVAERLHPRELGVYRPFELIAFAPGEVVHRFAWNGRELTIERGAVGPFASSAVAHGEARTARRARFAATVRAPTSQELERFHREHSPARGPLSTCMHRADAKTVSLARVRVSRDRVAMAYAPGSPCRSRFRGELEIARA